MDITKFSNKLNKIENNVYTIEEEVNLVDNVYDAELEHDNIDPNSISVYTGSKLTGQQITTWNKSIPSLNPCRTNIKIYSTITPLYITYETIGDTVEANDVNDVQDAIIYTQNESNAEKDKLTQDLYNEVQRATLAEANITTNLNNEITRATNKENTIQTNLSNEVTRAKAAESTLTTNLNNEITRAKAAESTLTTNLSNEVARATKAEGEITTNLNNEISRAKSAESTLTTNLNNEVTRATKAEQAIQTTIDTNKPIWNDKYTKAEIDNKISQVISDIDWKESVATYNDIAITYPTPQDGWTVNVKDTDITYRYSGSKWIEISANSIPLATSSVDGKMSKTDKSFLDTVKSLWTNVTTHISDAVKHITSAERTLWNTVSNKLDKSGGTLTGKLTIQGTAQSKPLNVRGINGITSDNTGDDHLFLNYGTTGNVFVNRDGNYVYTYDNLKRVSQLSNDAGYITQADVDTSQNHIHTNKTTLDKITEDNLTSWNGGVRRTAMIGSDVDGTNGWYKVAEQTCSSYGNQNITFMVTSTYGATNFGLLHLQIRSDNTSIYCSRFGWLSRFGFDVNNFIIVVNGMKWTLYANQTSTRYGRIAFEILSAFAIDRKNDAWPLTFKDNNTKETTAPTATTKSSDIATANHANSATIATQDSDGNQINTTYIKKNATNSTPFYKAAELGTNSYKVTTSFSWTSLSDGYNLRVAIPTNATGATSITVDSVKAPIKLSDGSGVSDLKAGGVYALTYYNGNFICASAGNNADDVTFTSNKLLTGYTANDSKGKAVEGTMKNNGSATVSLSCGSSYKISEGYYSGGTITANSLASQTPGNAGALQIVPPYTAWVNGAKVTGTMNVIQSAGDSGDSTNYHANATGVEYGSLSYGDATSYLYLSMPKWSYTSKNNWLRYPASTVANKIGLTADKLLAGNTILGINGNINTVSGAPIGSSGPNAFTDSKNMCKLALYNNDVGAFDLVFPRGYYDGVNTNRIHIPNLLPQNIVSGVQVGWEGNSITGTGGLACKKVTVEKTIASGTAEQLLISSNATGEIYNKLILLPLGPTSTYGCIVYTGMDGNYLRGTYSSTYYGSGNGIIVNKTTNQAFFKAKTNDNPGTSYTLYIIDLGF